MPPPLHPFSLDRMVNAVEKVRDRLLRVTRALETAGIDYAVVGGNAVAAWVARVDEAAVRNTQDVDVLIRRSDLESVRDVLSQEGFVFRHVKGVDMFLDGPEARPRDAVHVVFAGEKVRPEYELEAPDLEETEPNPPYRVLSLPALIRMKLTSFRIKDQMHLLDLIDLGLATESTLEGLPPSLAARLQTLLDHPDA